MDEIDDLEESLCNVVDKLDLPLYKQLVIYYQSNPKGKYCLLTDKSDDGDEEDEDDDQKSNHDDSDHDDDDGNDDDDYYNPKGHQGKDASKNAQKDDNDQEPEQKLEEAKEE